MFILNVKGFIKIKANFSLVYVIMTLVIEMKKIVIKENDANQRIDKYLKNYYVMHLVILYIRCLEKRY